ncbi:Holliday junction branch migration protein RuvA [Butyrivibrio sp. MC2013]|uniref:Holliday junction branch migration protein RuvA n=1 Tax=Butyrivibrio sp. MC2013 TaxID=1280686 RepID=UPI000402BFC9|nr:Holliday junction branch migration protein RuvA [Butyrivibrio sp. MC2013]
MISYLNGILKYLEEDLAVIDVGGVGFGVNISASTCQKMPGIGDDVTLYTYMSVKEDDISLYGFLSRDEIGLFKLLISVSGIGPKGALSILSVFEPDDLRFAILAGDVKSISKAPGVGKKTAERIALELKDKIGNEAITHGVISQGAVISGSDTADGSVRDEAVEALMALGYSGSDAMKAVRKVTASGDISDVGEILKLALKEM